MALVTILYIVWVFSTKVSGYPAFLRSTSNAPRFSKINYIFDVIENKELGSTIGRVRATGCSHDGDGPLEYSIHNDESSIGAYAFDIDKTTGSIRVKFPLDREMISVLEFKVTATCSISKVSTKSDVIVKIDDVNDNAPLFMQDIFETTIDVDTPVGTSIFKVNAMDSDAGVNGMITFQLIDNHTPSLFNIDHATGVITLASALRKDKNSYSFFVEARDGAIPISSSLMAIAEVNISIDMSK